MAGFTSEIAHHTQTGWDIVRLMGPGRAEHGQTVAQFMPQQGSNLFDLVVDGTDYLFGQAPAAGAALLGTPILYPMPNRVRDAQFTFAGRTFRFQPNNGPNFIHGLVRDQQWQVEDAQVTDHSVSVRTWISFQPGTAIYKLFPIRNTLELVYTMTPGAIRFDFTVRNEDPEQLLPFGLAIHPYFPIIGPRESVRIQVPVKKWMEAENLLPTGRLIDLAQGPADLRRPTSLARLNVDDVFWGMTEENPAVIYYDSMKPEANPRGFFLFHTRSGLHPCGQALFLHREPVLLDRRTQPVCPRPARRGSFGHPQAGRVAIRVDSFYPQRPIVVERFRQESQQDNAAIQAIGDRCGRGVRKRQEHPGGAHRERARRIRRGHGPHGSLLSTRQAQDGGPLYGFDL